MAKAGIIGVSPTILRKVAGIFANNGARQILAMVISALVARFYGVTGRGEYALFTSITPLLALVCSLGLVNALVFQLKSGIVTLKQAVFLLVLHASLTLPVILGGHALLQVLWPGLLLGAAAVSGWTVLNFVVYFVVLLVNLLLTSHLLAAGNTRLHRLQMILIPATTLLFLLAGTVVWGTEGFHPVIALVLSETVIAVYLVTRLWDAGSALFIPASDLKAAYSYALRSYISGMTGTVLAKIDNLMVAGFAGVSELGVYAVAKSFYQLIMSIPQAFAGYLFGLFVEQNQRESLALFFRISTLIFILTTGIALPLLLFPDWIVTTIFGPEFSGATLIIRVLVIAAIIASVSMPALRFMLAYDQPGLASLFSMASGLATAAALVVLVPKFSYVGAGYATLIGACLIFVLRFQYMMKRQHREMNL